MTTQTIEQERAGLSERRAALMQRRGEVAKLLRREHADGQMRRELQEEQSDLTSKIRAIEIDLETLNDVEQSEDQDRRAASIAEDARRRKLALDAGRNALAEVQRLAGVLQNAALIVAEAVSEFRATESQAKAAGRSAIASAAEKEAFTDCFPLLHDVEIEKLLANLPKGQVWADTQIVARVNRRVSGLLPAKEAE